MVQTERQGVTFSHSNPFHIGDVMVHLHFLRKLGLRHPQHHFDFYLLPELIPVMQPVIEDLKNVALKSYDSVSPLDTRNVWKNHDQWFGHQENRYNWCDFYISFFHKLAGEMGLQSTILKPSDFLLDYPALLTPVWGSDPVDVLVINSAPLSGQFRAYTDAHGGYFDPMLRALVAKGKHVVATRNTGVPGVRYTPPLSITEIGNLATRATLIVGVATGPMWTTLNVWAKPEKFVICLDCNETIDNAPNIVHVSSVDAAMREIGL